LRQTAMLQQQSEEMKRKQEEDKRRQAEMERKAAEMAEIRRKAEEERRIKEELEKQLREEAEEAAKALQEELSKLIEAAELEVTKVEEEASKLEGEKTHQECVSLGQEFEVVAQVTQNAVKACFDFMEGKHVKLKGSEEATMQACAALMRRSHTARASFSKASDKVRQKVKCAGEEIDAKTLQVELESQLIAAETEAESVKDLQGALQKATTVAVAEAKAGPEAGGGDADLELVRIATELEGPGGAAQKAVMRCMTILDGSWKRFCGPSEESKKIASSLNGRARKLKSFLEDALQKARTAKAPASQRIEREARKLAAKKEAERQEAIFKQYDKDCDGLLNEAEIKAYVQGEYGFQLAEDKLKLALAPSPRGVPHSEFARLRSQIGVAWSEVLAKQRKERNLQQMAQIRKDAAETQSGLAGVETEVAKAEAQARFIMPLLPRAAAVLELLTERTEEAEAAVDAARDFLAAAKEQAQSLGQSSKQDLETEAKQLAVKEGRLLGVKVTALEARLNRASEVVKNARGKVDLQLRKAALLAEASAM